MRCGPDAALPFHALTPQCLLTNSPDYDDDVSVSYYPLISKHPYLKYIYLGTYVPMYLWRYMGTHSL